MRILIAFMLCLQALNSFSTVYSDPDSSVKYLMNEPASLFDIGMIRLERHMEEFYIIGFSGEMCSQTLSSFF